jgi:bacterioferritin-associated ferredoxin
MMSMFVCSCHAVTDRTVDAAIASGATSIDEVASRCSAGSRCGGCWPELQRLLDDHDARHLRPRSAVA